MPTSAITGVVPQAPTGATQTATAPTRTPKQEYDSELFLGLLVSQLRNQDPSNAMDTDQLVAQTTSLAMMESLNKISIATEEAFSLQMRDTAANLIGKQVTYLDADGTPQTGTATSVTYLDAVPVVSVDGTPVRLDSIAAVNGTEAPASGATDGADSTPDA